MHKKGKKKVNKFALKRIKDGGKDNIEREIINIAYTDSSTICMSFMRTAY